MNSEPQSEVESSQASRPIAVGKAALVFILITVVLDVLSLSVTIPVGPKLIEGMVFTNEVREAAPGDFAGLTPDKAATAIDIIRTSVGSDARSEGASFEDAASELQSQLGFSAEQCAVSAQVSMADVTAVANSYSGFFGFVWALMQFVFAPFIGALSDRFGRRRVILISCLGLAIDYVLMALAPNLAWLFLGRVLTGITAASFATANAYIADVTPQEKRAATFGMVGAAWGFGFVFGPWFGGVLGEWGLRIPFWVAAGLAVVSFCYGLFILPESLPPEKRSRFRIANANPLGSLRLYASNKQLFGFAGILLLYQIAHQVFPCVFVFYAGHRYGWGIREVGETLMVVGLTSVFMQGFVIRKAAPMLGEKKMLYLALLMGAAGYFIYGTASNGWMFLAAIPVFAFVGFFNPAIQGLMTRLVDNSQQGQLQGANSSMMGISGMLGPLVFPFVFRVAISEDSGNNLPGAPFLLASGLHLVAFAVAIFLVRRNREAAGVAGADGVAADVSDQPAADAIEAGKPSKTAAAE